MENVNGTVSKTRILKNTEKKIYLSTATSATKTTWMELGKDHSANKVVKVRKRSWFRLVK